MRAGVTVNGPFSGKPSTATGAPTLAPTSGSGRRPRSRTRSTATSFRRSKATTSAGRRPPDCNSTTVSFWPATTWAAVTTRFARATQPVPSTPTPQAVPSTRTTLGVARRTPGSCTSLGSGGGTDAPGPAIVGNGSMRASALSRSVGGMTLFRRCSKAEPCAPRRRSVWPGKSSATAPRTQTSVSPASAPRTSPPVESNVLSFGLSIRVRSAAPASVPSVSSRIAPTAAPARAASGV